MNRRKLLKGTISLLATAAAGSPDTPAVTAPGPGTLNFYATEKVGMTFSRQVLDIRAIMTENAIRDIQIEEETTTQTPGPMRAEPTIPYEQEEQR